MIQINEPARTSVLDVVQRNLRAAGCVSILLIIVSHVRPRCASMSRFKNIIKKFGVIM